MARSISNLNSAFPKYKRKSVLLLLEKDSKLRFLLLEGESDLFYMNFVDSSINLFPITDSREYETGEIGSERLQKNAKEYVKVVIEKQLLKEKNAPAIKYGKCYGLIDKDFDFNETEKTKYEGRLECTDYSDLETTLLIFDYKNIEAKFLEDFKDSSIDRKSFNVLKKSIEYASEIGKLRKLREDKRNLLKGKLTNNIRIDFNYKENQTDGYYSLIKDKNDFNVMDYIGYVGKNNDTKNLIEEINKYTGNPLLYCRGHDIFNFIACFYKFNNKINIEKWKNYKGDIKILELRKDYEKKMEQFFDHEKFKETNIYSFFCRIKN